jgi:methionyl aminopeptidase
MINIKTPREIELMRKAGKIVYETHKLLEKYIKEGITTLELNDIAEKFILENNAKPSFKGYNGYPKAICTSVNEQVVHGIPGKYKLKEGDIISIDIGVEYQGYHGDSAWTYKVGKVSSDKEKLLENTEKVLYDSLKIIKPGIKLDDISSEIEKNACKYKLGIVKELVGHGIGNKMHEDPNIPNYSIKNKGPTIKEGMTLAIEPMLVLGSPKIVIEEDGWTISTLDNSPAAHFEHTILVIKDGYEILTGA